MKIQIKVFTRCSFIRLEKVDNCFYKIWLTQAREKGKANKQLIGVLSKELDVSKSAIKILKGKNSSEKILEIV